MAPLAHDKREALMLVAATRPVARPQLSARMERVSCPALRAHYIQWVPQYSLAQDVWVLLAQGPSPMDLLGWCSQCGTLTGSWCDGCEEQARARWSALCSMCDRDFGECTRCGSTVEDTVEMRE